MNSGQLNDVDKAYGLGGKIMLGIIGAMAGVIGSLQAMEAIKYLLGTGELLTGKLLTYHALQNEFRTVKLPDHVPDCPVCGKR